MSQRDVARLVVRRHGRTYAQEAGIRLADTPSPLWRLLVLADLLSARISADIAVAAARELSSAGFRTAKAMAAASWQQRVDALGRGHYKRYDERTATILGKLADQCLDRYGGDLRRLHAESGDVEALTANLEDLAGFGSVGAAIFTREVQHVWRDLAPYVDATAADGAARLGLPRSATRLSRLVPPDDFASLVAGCVRAARDDSVVDDVRAA